MRFGIVTPTYNRFDELMRAVDSVRRQTYSDWLMVVVDDSTNDFTQLHWVDFPKITYIRNPANLGVGPSRNRGIQLLLNQVDFIVFLDDDDNLDVDCLKNAAIAIKKFPERKWFVSRKVFRDSNESRTLVKKIQPDYSYVDDYLVGKKFKRDATHFIAASLLRTTGARFAEIRGGGEWRFFAQLDKASRFHFFEGGVTYINYGQTGLTALNTADLNYKVSEQIDLALFLTHRRTHKLKRIELSSRIIRHLITLNQPERLTSYWKEAVKPLPKAAQWMLTWQKIFLMKRRS